MKAMRHLSHYIEVIITQSKDQNYAVLDIAVGILAVFEAIETSPDTLLRVCGENLCRMVS